MKFDKVNLLVIILALAVIILLVKDWYKGRNDTVTIGDVSFQNDHYDKQGTPKKNTGIIVPDAQELKEIWASGKTNSVQNQVEQIRSAATKSLDEFKEIARIDFELSQSMHFTKLDLEHDRIIGTYGISNGRTDSLAVLATDTRVTEKLVMAYLRDYADELPNLRRKRVVWGQQPEAFPPVEGSGLSGAKVWLGNSADGSTYAAAYFERLDRKGHYVFVYSNINPNAFENDGFFDGLYSTLKAVPAQ